jgi:hypothetical protein
LKTKVSVSGDGFQFCQLPDSTITKSRFGYPGQGLRSLNSPRCLAWQKDEGALETWLMDNERERRSKLRLYEKESKILEN